MRKCSFNLFLYILWYGNLDCVNSKFPDFQKLINIRFVGGDYFYKKYRVAFGIKKSYVWLNQQAPSSTSRKVNILSISDCPVIIFKKRHFYTYAVSLDGSSR